LISIHEPWKVGGSVEQIAGRLSGTHSSHDLAHVIRTSADVFTNTPRHLRLHYTTINHVKMGGDRKSRKTEVFYSCLFFTVLHCLY